MPSQEKYTEKENKSIYHERNDKFGLELLDLSFMNLFPNSAFSTSPAVKRLFMVFLTNLLKYFEMKINYNLTVKLTDFCSFCRLFDSKITTRFQANVGRFCWQIFVSFCRLFIVMIWYHISLMFSLFSLSAEVLRSLRKQESWCRV